MITGFRHGLAALLLFLLAACSSSPSPLPNRPLDYAFSDKSEAVFREGVSGRSDDLGLILTFSGGGTRAAALSYGVLQALRDTHLNIGGHERRLLDEVDVISSVSGGSFTAAYYGLFGDRIFSDYEQRFLKKDVQMTLLGYWLSHPHTWWRQISGMMRRSDVYVDYFDKTLFEGQSFRNLRADSPEIVMNATELGSGQSFSFDRYNFNLICSDLDSFPIGRAVAASSAVPVVFTPITLQNHAGNCMPPSRPQIPGNLPEKRREALNGMMSWQDSEKYPYLHLVDGGVADNLGVRPLLDRITLHGGDMWSFMQDYGMQDTHHLVFVVVNAENFAYPAISRSPSPPTAAAVVSRVMAIQLGRYDVETFEQLRSQFPLWRGQIQAGRCAGGKDKQCDDMRFYLIEVNMKNMSPRDKQELQRVPASFSLQDRQVDLLTAAGRRLLRASPEYQRLLRELK